MEGGACCAHDHDCSENECGGSSLQGYIDTTKVGVLNSSNPACLNSPGGGLLRDWSSRLNRGAWPAGPLLSEDDDPELLLHIPFTSLVKIKSIMVIGGEDGSSPDKMRVFLNRDDLDFETVNDLPPVQEWTLVENSSGTFEYPTQFRKFQGISSITLHFPSVFNGDQSALWYIGFRGEGTTHQRKAVANVVYESKPQPQDHKSPVEDGTFHLLQ